MAGVSLVGHALLFAKNAGLFDAIHLSTDDEEIAQEGTNHGYRPQFLRSAQASSDRSSATEVVREVRDSFLAMGESFDQYVLLEPTSPMRTVVFVAQAIQLVHHHFDAAFTVSPINPKFHADKQFSVLEDGTAKFLTESAHLVISRQELLPTYIRNGFCYVVTNQALTAGATIMGRNPGAVICNVPFVNIDTSEDLAECRRLMEQNA